MKADVIVVDRTFKSLKEEQQMSIYQQASGPFEESVVMTWLQGGQLSPEALACRHGASEWQPATTGGKFESSPPFK